MISFENVSKKYKDGTYAVNEFNLHINEGELLVLIGPSGSGKTTTLKMINRLIPLTEGTIKISDIKISDYDIHELRWDIGYVLQQIALFPHMTIEENIAVVPELKKWESQKINHRIDELLHMVGLDPKTYRKRKPHELSGGQQQRIGVARALAANPPIILMDEPFSALDPISREKLQDDLIVLQKDIKKTIVFVTHDMKEALKLGDRICLMKEGRIVQTGTPDEFLYQPANDFVREFVGIDQGREKRVSVREGMIPLKAAEKLTNMPVIATDASMSEIAGLLSEHDELAVKEMGEIVGTLNRQGFIRILSSQMEGKLNE
ncbi:ABC transporter ATP-binding protein [Mesobacillus subterraneus]|uniref:ABC transporter ATP-binding protein n=1 Tax=Mesobacillus subterraneus TaxID=285983 RepID=UPI00203BF092|nr:ABC transporter ATP-binding protein [Mesobacillus subterraneus]MCM3666366.1 ABC transporter ATP-binding protein [Mesobacillus subterraneus]MCM3685362.1 ABC transporter ATP-binding protein [Mesobacillus subterraneus]